MLIYGYKGDKCLKSDNCNDYTSKNLIALKNYNIDLYKTTKNGLFDNGTNYWIGKIGTNVNTLYYAKREKAAKMPAALIPVLYPN